VTDSKPQPSVISYVTMRKAIGWLGMSLPFILLLGNFFVNACDILNNTWLVKACNGYKYAADGSWKSSISHYYYSTVGELFTGTLCAVSLFMFSYKGYPRQPGHYGLSDSLMTNLAGFFALGVVIFPTSASDCIKDNVRTFLSSDVSGAIHLGFAALFFFTLAFMSIINFRNADTKDKFGKGDDDKFYLRCGIVMLSCIAIISVYNFFLEGIWPWLDNMNVTFVFEAIALIAFGSSWLKKGAVDFLFVPKRLSLIKK
jgi:hypothetical protein